MEEEGIGWLLTMLQNCRHESWEKCLLESEDEWVKRGK